MSNRAIWNEREISLFIEFCVEQVRLGKRAGGHLRPSTFAEVAVKLQHATGRALTPTQLRSKWDTLRKVWVKWRWLKRYAASGVGWNENTHTFDAPEEWWEVAEEAYKKTKTDSILQFRWEGLKHADSLDEMFKGTKGTNRRVWTPSSSVPPPEDSAEGNGDSDGDPRFADPLDNNQLEDQPVQNSYNEGEPSSKRKQPLESTKKRFGRRRYSRDDLTNDLGNLIATLQARSYSSGRSVGNENRSASIAEAMKDVWALPAVVENRRIGLEATDIFIDERLREFYIACPDNDTKTEFLFREFAKRNGN